MTSSSQETIPPTRRRAILLRAGAVCLALLLLACLEGVLRVAGLGKIADVGDPFVGFSEIVPLFELNDDGTRYEIATGRQDFFRPDSFRAEKPDNEFRIFCLGGSTVQGRPYAIETSFTTWLELTLKAADPSREWRVVNCGGVSYASYRLIPILKEAITYKPDLFIVYTGHNEFLEARTYENIKQRPEWLKVIHERAVRSRLYGTLSQLVQPSATADSNKVDLPTEVDALLDYEGGLAKYHRDDKWHHSVVVHYENNLRRMIRLADQARVPVLLANPVSNIRDTAPFKVEANEQLTEKQQQTFEKLWEEAKQSSWEDLETKRAIVEGAVNIDPRHAEAHFLLAKVLEAAGHSTEAAKAYYRAKDEDICPLRMTEAMHEVVFRVANQGGAPLIDVRRMFEEKSETGIPGDDQLIDHVHPRIPGHQSIAELLFNYMVDEGIVAKQPGWEERREKLFKDNFARLPDAYFPIAVSRLEGLNNWARGRATKIRPNKPVAVDSERSAVPPAP